MNKLVKYPNNFFYDKLTKYQRMFLERRNSEEPYPINYYMFFPVKIENRKL